MVALGVGDGMGTRRGTGRAWCARLGRWAGFLALALTFAMPPARAGAPLRALDLHVVVLNGALIGSGFAIADGAVVTNRHVVRGLAPGARVRLLARQGGVPLAATVLALSPRMDLALLRVAPGLLPVVPAAPAPVGPGSAVVAAGIDASDGPSGARYEAPGEILEASAEIAAFGPGLIARLPRGRPGFSGGPLLDGQGRLVGMVTALRTRGGAVSPAASARGAAIGPQTERQTGTQTEAYALRAHAVRAEVARLLGASRGGR